MSVAARPTLAAAIVLAAAMLSESVRTTRATSAFVGSRLLLQSAVQPADLSEDVQVTPTARKGWVYEYTTQRSSEADLKSRLWTPLNNEDVNAITAVDSCARQCGKTVGCVAFAFDEAETACTGCYNCYLYTRVPALPQYAPNYISGYRKIAVPKDFKASTGITVDNTTGVAVTSNDIMHPPPGTSTFSAATNLKVICSGVSLEGEDETPAASAAGGAEGHNVTTAVSMSSRQSGNNTMDTTDP